MSAKKFISDYVVGEYQVITKEKEYDRLDAQEDTIPNEFLYLEVDQIITGLYMNNMRQWSTFSVKRCVRKENYFAQK